MMQWLKADFHTHTSDDPLDDIDYSAEELIDNASKKGIQVLSISCHTALVYDEYLVKYAEQHGVFLIPALEANFEGTRHVLIINPAPEHLTVSSFDEFRAVGKKDALLIAPHPYYPGGTALREYLEPNIDLFDAIEYSNFYRRNLNFWNKKAKKIAEKYELPLVGNSDTHVLPYVDSTHTLIRAERNIPSIFEAIRSNNIRLHTAPRHMVSILKMLQFAFFQELRDRKKARPQPNEVHT
jgi:hypothetical protein